MSNQRNRKYVGKRKPKGNGKPTGMNEAKVEAKFNDPSWYAANAQLLKDAASFSFNNAVGGKIDLNPRNGLTATALDVQAVPGIMTFGYVPAPGISVDNSSAINIAARNIYSFVRHANSGHANYDSPDLMMYLLAMDSIYMMFNYAKRMYGTALLYSQYNRYLPAGLLVAQYADATDVMNNLANFRYALNTIAAKVNAMYVPSVMPYFIRHSWMASNVWKDSSDEKSQLYLFRPRVAYKLVEQGTTPGLMLEAVDVGAGGLWKVSSLISLINTLIAAVIESEDMNIMSGDLRKAYGPEKAFLLSAVSEDYLVQPVYKEEVLNQIHNMIVVDGFSPQNNSILINNDTNAIVYHPSLGVATFMNHDHILNMPWQNVEPSDTMVASRLMVAGEVKSNINYLKSIGSEFICNLDIIIPSLDGASSPSRVMIDTTDFFVGALDTNVKSVQSTVALISQFDWHPIFYLGLNTDAGQELTGIMGDMDNYTIISDEGISKMNETAILSELGVPVEGRI